MSTPTTIPVIDVEPLLVDAQKAGAKQTALEIDRACRDQGFFYIRGHGVSTELIHRLDRLSREFFAQDLSKKRSIRMALAGQAWRGYFGVGDELTAGQPDQKEGIYFGQECGPNHPRVRTNTPLHGANLFPAIAGFRETILEYMDALTDLGQAVMRGIALGLDLDPDFFQQDWTREPTVLFRIFHYPSLADDARSWSVGEHTDYGLLTLLLQDSNGGLQVKTREGEWLHAPPIENTLVCNLGDMLERITGGHYRSTPHRVRNQSECGRLSFPLFFDPGWDAEIRPILPIADGVPPDRWDGADLQNLSGAYGEYLLKKVAKVFPDQADFGS